jgi:hypothetical protein
MHSITLNQNWKKVRVTLDPTQSGPSRKGNEPILLLTLYRVYNTNHKRIRVSTQLWLVEEAASLTYLGEAARGQRAGSGVGAGRTGRCTR